ncbi:MAG: glycosyltransferase [Bacteroidota bacterium]|nr:glycosyltransferase [Bacteroidota bacterium]
MESPLVSVVIPVYNASAYLKDSVDSIVQQSYKNLEILIINDGSTDTSSQILSGYSDERIRVITHSENQGIIISLNTGIKQAKGKYIARMDADDQSHPERIKKQVEFLENNPSVGVLGTYIQNHQRFSVYSSKWFTSKEIKSRLLFDNILSHPTIMFRTDVIQKFQKLYSPEFIHAEDYAFWLASLDKTDFALIPEALLNYREHAGQISVKKREQQMESVKRAQMMIFKKLGIDPSAKEQKTHERIFFLNYDYSAEFISSAESWLLKLKSANEQAGIFEVKSYENILSWTWFEICTDFASKKFKCGELLKRSNLYQAKSISLFYRIKFELKNSLAKKSI